MKEIEIEEKIQKKENPLAKWYAIKSAAGREKSIANLILQRVRANNLEDKILDVVVPTQEKVVIKKGKKSTVQEKIMQGYILVHMEVNEETMHLIRNTEDVQGFVGYSTITRKPKPLSSREVDSILAFMVVKQEPIHKADFNVGDAIKVTEGTWKDFIGSVKEVNVNKGQATVMLEIFGRETPVQLDFLQINKI